MSSNQQGVLGLFLHHAGATAHHLICSSGSTGRLCLSLLKCVLSPSICLLSFFIPLLTSVKWTSLCLPSGIPGLARKGGGEQIAVHTLRDFATELLGIKAVTFVQAPGRLPLLPQDAQPRRVSWCTCWPSGAMCYHHDLQRGWRQKGQPRRQPTKSSG